MTEHVREAVSIRTHFERFPATVKGAFVIRGDDPNPHQVAIREARAVVPDGSVARTVEMSPVVLDVPPHIDLFVPFELPVSDLEPGWYGLECDAEVDGIATTYPAARHFVVPWPRGAVRRGTVPVGRALRSASRGVEIGSLECTVDSTKIRLTADPAEEPALRLSVDGRSLPILDVAVDEDTGEGTVSAYPLLRTDKMLRISLTGGHAPSLEITLP